MQSHYSPAGETTLQQLNTLKNIDASMAERFSLPREHLAAAAFRQIDDSAGRGQSHASHAAEVLEQFLNQRLSGYEGGRDQFADDHTSHLARYLNTGALSARQAYEAAQQQFGAEAWIRQLAWRDFFLYQGKYNEDFYRYEQKLDLSALSDQHFEAWSEGKTGIPVIDAAMKQLNETGEMPNRLRMVTAMFLTKNLLCPFTLGEQYFRRQLADYDHTLNRGGWLWSSSLGYDAAPYFRIMNPATQSATHDPSGTYIRRWLPELAHLPDKQIHLPQPHAIVDLKASRARAIEIYKEIV
ncbi:FAD-binding domain-containing protein [Paenibacillus sp. Leaf72]|uniref:FAD-binding domain-containing protein n=1 Tax=Paenibacillus sp. Leaf72 TaxID=1736234 RepID=UPI001F17351B|nr:FAD-binding domain-containing protein [Paenibacillus sp. Leaf72]